MPGSRFDGGKQSPERRKEAGLTARFNSSEDRPLLFAAIYFGPFDC
jgi:hypothetical protein